MSWMRWRPRRKFANSTPLVHDLRKITQPKCECLLDLGFAELNVLLGDRVVLLLDELVGHGARVLARHIVKAGVGAGHELDLDVGGLGHGRTSIGGFAGNLEHVSEKWKPGFPKRTLDNTGCSRQSSKVKKARKTAEIQRSSRRNFLCNIR